MRAESLSVGGLGGPAMDVAPMPTLSQEQGPTTLPAAAKLALDGIAGQALRRFGAPGNVQDNGEQAAFSSF